MSDESVFLTYVRFVLKRWTGLQLAIQHGMGGCYANEKEVWFSHEIENFFRNNADLYRDEVEDFISAILLQEFETIAEDGSITEISSELCKVFDLCKSGKEDEVRNMFSQKSILPSATISSISDEQDDEEIEETSLVSEVQQLKLTNEVTTTATSTDGWTKVQRGKKYE